MGSGRGATRDAQRVCVLLDAAGAMSRSRGGGREIVAWNYDAHTPNFPSLSEVRAPGYAAGSFPPGRTSSRLSPVHPYPLVRERRYTASPFTHISHSPPLPPAHLSPPIPLLAPILYIRIPRAWQRRSAPSNRRPLICFHVFTCIILRQF